MIAKRKINQIQNFTQKILRKSGKRGMSLKELAKDNCSEISRLAGCFALKSWRGTAVYVLKGDCVFGRKQSHEILAIQEGEKVYVLDPSVWQFFFRKKSILVGDADNILGAIKLTKGVYKGSWKISEKLLLKDCKKKQTEWLSVICQNNAESC